MAIQDYLSDIQSYTGGAQAAADQASQQYAQAAGAGATLPMKLKEALGAKLNYNKDIIEQQNAAMGDYFAAPAVAREKYQNIWNPFEREKLVATARSQAYQPYANFTDILGQRMGQVSDIVGQGVAGWQSVVQQAAALAQAAQQKYQSVLNEYLSAAGMQEKADTLAEQQRQYNTTQAWNEKKFGIEQASKGSGSGGLGSKADTATMKVWDSLKTDALKLFPNDENAAADYAWRQIVTDQNMLAKNGINVADLYAAQRAWKQAYNGMPQQSVSSPTTQTLTPEQRILNWNPKVSSYSSTRTNATPLDNYLNLGSYGNVPLR